MHHGGWGGVVMQGPESRDPHFMHPYQSRLVGMMSTPCLRWFSLATLQWRQEACTLYGSKGAPPSSSPRM